MRKLLLLTFFAGTFMFSFAQDFSNRGKDFWLCYPAHIDGTNSRMALYISAGTNTTGIVQFGTTSIPFNVVANQASVVQIFPNAYSVINNQNEGVASGKGIHITSQAPIVVYSHILNNARSGSSLILPTNTLGREYIASSYASSTSSQVGGNGSAPGSQFCVVGVEDNTIVEITPKAPDVDGKRKAGIPFTVTLNRGDVYQYRTVFSDDVTGTRIRSISTPGIPCKPIAVFSGSSWTSMNCISASGGDNLFQQLMPKSAWGKNYVTAPFANRQYDIFRIIVDDSTTQVTRNGSVLPSANLVKGSYYEFSSSGPNVITTDKPIMLVQYMISQTCDTRNSTNNIPYPGDPEMIIVNPIEQTVSDVTVVSARNNLTPPNTSITSHYFTIIMKTAATSSLKIDGNAPNSSFIPISGTLYSYLQENVTASTNANPSHRIKADSGFIALAYGLGNVESYGYNAGTNIRDLYQFISIENDYGTVNFPAGCKGSPFKFSITFPYQPTHIKWIFGSGLNGFGIKDTLIASPASDSSWILDGKTIYRYKLNVSYSIPQSGVFPIAIQADNPTPDGCSGLQEIEYDLQIFDNPVADFSFTHTGCVTDSIAFMDNTNGLGRSVIRWYWDFGDATTGNAANPKHRYSTAGNRTVRHSAITDVGCLSDTVSKVIPISDPPVAKFGVSAITCEKTSVTFSDSSTVPLGNIVKWKWDLGDGTIINASNGNSVQHTYTTAGSYIVTLEVETNTGCKSFLFTRAINIYPKPLADFTLPSVCLPLSTTFTDISTIADGTQNSFTYAWDFGDGQNATQKNPVHQYSTAGPFNVKLIVTSSNGCVDDSLKVFSTIYEQPKIKVTAPAEKCFGDSVRVAIKINTPTGLRIKSYDVFWSNEAPASATLNADADSVIVYHVFGTAGAQTVKVVVRSGLPGSCTSDTVTVPVYINKLPIADYTIAAITCEGQSVAFTDASTTADGTINKWSWVFGNSNTSIQQNPSTVYATAGNYTSSLIVESNKGCVSTSVSKPVVIHNLPDAKFGTPEVCLSDPFANFTDSSIIADNSESQFTFLWNFGDANANAGNPNTSAAKNPQHKFTAVGLYTIGLKVTSKDGCVDTASKQFTVNGSVPLANFSVTNTSALCSNLPISLKDASTVDFGSIVKVEVYWDYGNDPTIKTVEENPVPGQLYTHKYPDFGNPTKTFRVRYVAYSGINCINEITKDIVVNGSPSIQFDPLAAICEEIAPVQLTAARELFGFAGTGVYSGDGTTGTGMFSPAQAKPGLHTIRYTFNASNGCTSFAEQTIRVNATPVVDAGPDRVVLEGGYITIQAKGTGNNVSILWTPSTGLDNNKIINPKSSPTEDITYLLTVTTADGCKDDDDVFVKVLRTPKIPNVFSPNGDGINDAWVIEYLESYPGAVVEVFNRYGQLVYHSVGYTKPWDGNYNGSPLPVATYYWVIQPKNGRQPMKGSVTIIR